MGSPADRRYSETHEWHLVEGDKVRIGLTRHAVDELTDVTFVELPKTGKKVEAGQSWGEIESVKATSEIYSAFSGEVVEVNENLRDQPGLVNSDPYGAGWLIVVKIEGKAGGAGELMTADEYDAKYA